MLEIIEKILRIFAKNGLFDEGVELIGSWSFLCIPEISWGEVIPFRDTGRGFSYS